MFNFLKKKTAAAETSAERTEAHTFTLSELDTSQVAEKFADEAKQAFARILDTFLKLESLDKAFNENVERLRKEKQAQGIDLHRETPTERECINAYFADYKQIAQAILTPRMLEEYAKHSMGGSPSPFEFLTRGDMRRTVSLAMKTAGKITIETSWYHGLTHRNKYELRKDDATGAWNIDKAFYGFEDGTWHKQHWV